MKQGKHICETLKAIRSEIADANEIDYQPTECTHEGDCVGTCPKCESETRWLERQLRARQALGKTIAIAGLSVALGAMSSCNFYEKYKRDRKLGEVTDSSYCSQIDDEKGKWQGEVDQSGNPDVDTINSFTPLCNDNETVSQKSNDDDYEVMGEVAVDENGNIGDL